MSEYVIVRREPTREMHLQARGYSDNANVYRAMLAASPRPQSVLTDAEAKRLSDQAGISTASLLALEQFVLRKLGWE